MSSGEDYQQQKKQLCEEVEMSPSAGRWEVWTARRNNGKWKHSEEKWDTNAEGAIAVVRIGELARENDGGWQRKGAKEKKVKVVRGLDLSPGLHRTGSRREAHR